MTANGIKLKAGGETKYQCEADKICLQTDAFRTDIRHLLLGCVRCLVLKIKKRRN